MDILTLPSQYSTEKVNKNLAVAEDLDSSNNGPAIIDTFEILY